MSHKTARQRFREKYKKRANGCWEWVGATVHTEDPKRKYGVFFYKGKRVLAHRLSFEKHKKRKIPKGMKVCHKCDNPPCVRPIHLFLGTQKDNLADCIQKGRWNNNSPKGEQCGKSRLTEKQVLRIRKDPRTQKQIAASYGISQTNVSDIKRRRIWKHI